MNNITAHTLVVDNVTIREDYTGLFSVNGGMNVAKDLNVVGNTLINKNVEIGGYTSIHGDTNVNGNMEITENTLFHGDIRILGNAVATQNLTINGIAAFNGNMNINGTLKLDYDLTTIGNVVVGNDLVFDGTGKFMGANLQGVGLNTETPQYGLDIVTDNSSGFSIYSSQPTNTNILAQNGNHYGILTTTSDASSSIQFFNDTAISTGISGAKIQYNRGKELVIDTSNTTLFSGLVVSKDKSKQGHFSNETVVVYDVSDGLFMAERFQDSSLKKGQAITLMTTDTSSITFMNWKTPAKNGISMGGGIYPMDKTRSMGVVGWTDVSSQFIPSWNLVSGNSAVISRSTVGINTITNRTDNFVLDINGPVHLTHEQIAKTLTSGFEIKQVLFGDTSGKGISIGTPSTDISSNFRQDILFTSDGGQKWSINRNLGNYASNIIEQNTHYLTGTSCQNFTFVSAYDPTNTEKGGFMFYSADYGNKWSVINNFIKNGTSLNSFVNVVGLSSVYLSGANIIRVFVIYKTTTNGVVMTYFDIPTTDQNILLSNVVLPVLKYVNSGSLTYGNFDTPFTRDPSNNPLYTYLLSTNFVHNTSLYDISGNNYGTTITDLNFVQTSIQGYVYLVGTINGGSKILWVDSGLDQSLVSTKYTDISLFSCSGLAVGSNNNAVVVGKNTGTNTGVIYYTNTGTTSSWSLANIYGVSGSIPLINDVYVLDETHGMAVGNSGLILYSSNAFVDWYVVSQDWLRCFGNTSLLNSLNWAGVSMPNSSTFILTSLNRSYTGTVGTRAGSSDQYIFYWPNLFSLSTNDLLDVSGNIRMDGYLRVGNLSDNSIQTTGGINTAGNVVIQGSATIYNNLEIRGNLVLNRNINLIGNLVVNNTKIVVERSVDSGVGTGAIAIGDYAGTVSQNGYAIAIGSNSGQSNQGVGAIAIGSNSGQITQGMDAIAIGVSSGNTQQGNYSVAIGTNSGEKNQGIESVAIGLYTGNTGQGNDSIAIGKFAGKQNQGSMSLAFGTSAGENQQGNGSIAMGTYAGFSQQGIQSIAFGNNAGQNQQGNYSVALGLNSGQNQQGIYSVSIGFGAGQNQQNTKSIAIGYYAGYSQQGGHSIAIGETAGKVSQGANTVAIGYYAGSNGQMDYSLSLGSNAGENQQNFSSIAFGRYAGRNQQGGNAIAIGTLSGNTSQGGNAISIGNLAGSYSQGSKSISIGFQTGQTSQNNNSVAIGQNAGSNQQQGLSVAIGYYAGSIQQGQKSVAIGHYSGYTAQGQYTVAIGPNAGQTQQGDSSVSLGNQAGQTQQGGQSVAIGYLAGQGTQGGYSVALGTMAGQTKQGVSAVAIGQNAGAFTQGGNAVAIGYYAGNISQGLCSIAIGNGAGSFSQGEYSIAIGFQVGQTNQTRNTVAIGKNIVVSSENALVLNSSASSITGGQPGFFVKPVRASKDTNLLYYNSGTGEIRYADLSAYDIGVLGATLGISTTTITATGRISAIAGITATSDISANGNITTNSLTAQNRITAVGGITSTLDISANGNITTNFLTAQNRIIAIGGITATSDISANGNITTNSLTAQNRITAVGGITTNSDISANGNITANYLTTQNRIITADGITSFLDISANKGITTTTIGANNRIYAYAGITSSTDISANTGMTTSVLTVQDRITATGGITATSDISANGGITTSVLTVQNRITAIGGITATSDISANGGITTSTLKIINPPVKSSETKILYYDTTGFQVKYGDVPPTISLNPYSSGDIQVSAGNMYVNNNTATIYTGAQNTTGTTYSRLYTNGTINATGQIQGASFNATSDRRLKQDIISLGSMLEKINRLEPVEYKWKKTGDKDFGFIAQDYYKIFPDLKPKELHGEEPVDENGEPKYYTMDYGKITCFLTKAIQELSNHQMETGIHGRSQILENQHSVLISIHPWDTHRDYIVQLTPIHGNRVISSSPVEKGQFTVYGETGPFFWSVFPETVV